MRQVLISGLNYFRRRTGFQWGGGEIILAGILIFGILSMGSGMFGKWMRASREGGLLMVDLHSFSSADYGVDEMPVSVPAIGLEIIQDLLGVRRPPETGRPGGIALVTPNNPTPTPTLPWTGPLPWTSTPAGGIPVDHTPTSQSRNTATPAVQRSPTPTAQQPVGTTPPQEPGPTDPPTATPWISPTLGPATSTAKPPQPQPTSTQEPVPELPTSTPPPPPPPTTQPGVSATPRPTPGNTRGVTPKPRKTPGGTTGPTQKPSDLNSPRAFINR